MLTDSGIGSGDQLWVQFFSSEDESKAAGFSISFGIIPKYSLGYCEINRLIDTRCFQVGDHNVWTIRKENKRVMLNCNKVQIFDIDTSLSAEEDCEKKWSIQFDSMRFYDDGEKSPDTASDFYRPYTTGK